MSKHTKTLGTVYRLLLFRWLQMLKGKSHMVFLFLEMILAMVCRLSVFKTLTCVIRQENPTNGLLPQSTRNTIEHGCTAAKY